MPITPLTPISVTVSLEQPLPTAGRFGKIPAYLATVSPSIEAAWPGGPTAVTARVSVNDWLDFMDTVGAGPSDEIYRHAESYMVQRDGRGNAVFPEFLVLVRRATPVAQVETVEVVGSDDGEYEIVLDWLDDAQTVSFTASGNTEADIKAGLIADGNAKYAGKLTFAPQGGDPPFQITVTSDVAGVPFSIAVSAPNDNLTLDSPSTVANVGVGEDLALAIAEDPDIYEVSTTVGPYDGRVLGRAVEALAATRRLTCVPQSSEAGAIAVGTEDTAAFVAANKLQRTSYVYHHSDVQPAASAWSGRVISLNPGRINRAWNGLSAGTSFGMTPSDLTAGEAAALTDKFGNFYADIAGGVTRLGTNGAGTLLEYVRLADFIATEALLGLQNVLKINDIVTYDAEGIALLLAELRRVCNRFAGPQFQAIFVPGPEDIVALPRSSQDPVDIALGKYRGLQATLRIRNPVNDLEVLINLLITG